MCASIQEEGKVMMMKMSARNTQNYYDMAPYARWSDAYEEGARVAAMDAALTRARAAASDEEAYAIVAAVLDAAVYRVPLLADHYSRGYRSPPPLYLPPPAPPPAPPP